MRLLRLIFILLIGCFLCPQPELDAARKRKGARTSVVAKSRKGKKATKEKSSSRRSKRSSKKERSAKNSKRQGRKGRWSSSRRSASLSKIDYETRRAELRTSDSIRLRIGGTEPLRMGQAVTQIANFEPTLVRFRRADSTLTKGDIESLYYTRKAAEDDGTFFGHIIPRVDSAIMQQRYSDALTLAQKGLYRNPMHIGLIKRACDLSEHFGSAELDLYLWQITELLSLIDNTGDGKSVKTAMRVRSEEDALLFEQLWLDTIAERIMEKRYEDHAGQRYLVLSVREPRNKISKKYYLVG